MARTKLGGFDASPLGYMFGVINDPSTDLARRQAMIEAATPYCRSCQRCGLPIFRKFNKMCSEACRSAARVDVISRRPRYQGICAACGKTFSATAKPTKTCSLKCGNTLRRSFRKRIYETVRDRQRQQNSVRRARRKAVEIEKFSAVEIFNRDSWRCGLCGKKVDRRLRHPHRLSACLDHIVPLSKGGAHTRQNTQCAHLSCNSRKNAGPGGQLRLFG